MNQSNLTAFLGRLGLITSQPAKRIAKGRTRWGTEAEQLENRALLSAATHHVDSSISAETATDRHMKPPKLVYPTVAGTWHVNVTGGTLGQTSGTAVVTQDPMKPTAVSSVITLLDEPAIHSSGKFTKSHSHVISGSAKVDIAGFGEHTVKLTITFGAGDHPTTFTGTIALGKVTLGSFNGVLNGVI